MDELESLIEHQIQLHDLVKKQLNNFKKDPSDRKTKAYFNTRLSTLESHYSTFHGNHKSIISIADSKKTEYIKKCFIDTFEDSYFESVLKIKEGYEKIFTLVASSNQEIISNKNDHASQPRVRLPKVTLPTFSGDCSEWPSFFDAFKTIHTDNVLTPSQKFQYLKGVLAGSAELLIRHLSITDENYSIAMTELEKTYNDKRLIFTQQMNAFLSQASIKSDNFNDIQQLLGFSRATIRIIEKLNVDASEAIFVHLVLQKLAPETKSFCLQTFPPKTIPVWADLEKALEIRLNSLPVINSKLDNQQFTPNLNTSAKEKGKFNQKSPHSVQKKSRSFHISKQDICINCKESHTIRKCPSFTQLPAHERKPIVEKFKLCFNCLGSNHSISNCPSKKNCFTCGGRHHTLLHNSRIPNQSNAVPSSSSSTTDIATTVTHTMNTKMSARQILLATAIVKIRSHNGHLIQLRALLDQGSQASIITEAAAQRLGLPKTSVRAQINGVGNTQSNQTKFLVSLTIQSCRDKNFETHTDAFILTKLTSKLPTYSINNSDWPHIHQLPLADPNFAQPIVSIYC